VGLTPVSPVYSVIDLGDAIMPEGVLSDDVNQIGPPPETDFFDADFYRLANPDLLGLTPEQLEVHFRERAIAEGRSFIPVYDAQFYRTNNPDLAGLSDRALFDHFINIGLGEGRKFSPVFDIDFYRQNLLLTENGADIIEQLTPEPIPENPALELFADPQTIVTRSPSLNENLYKLFLESELGVTTDLEEETGFNPEDITEEIDYSPFFDPLFYLNNNPDLAEAFGTNTEQALQHFVTRGINEPRRASLIFDPIFYIRTNPDLEAAGLATPKGALFHYEINGLPEGRRPSLFFDPQFYVASNPDLRERGLDNEDLIDNFILVGLEQERRSSLFFDPRAINSLIIPQTTQTEEEAQQADDETPPNSTENLLNGDYQKWPTPIGGILTYSFVTQASAVQYEGTESGVGEVNEAIKNNVRQIMNEYNQVLPFDLIEVADRPPNTGQIRILFADNPNYAYSYAPGLGTGGDIVLSRNFETDQNRSFSQGAGNFGYQRLVHEIGHALGLRQPNDYTGFAFAERPTFPAGGSGLPFNEDNSTNTAMSFNIAGVGASTPMTYDVRALQFLYGFNDANLGDDVYRFDGASFIGVKQTIWDAGGVDTFDFSELPPSDSYFFDLNEGGQSTNQTALNAATYQAINDPSGATYAASSYATRVAYGTTIENLIGSAVNDEILGNNAANRIEGGSGADRITGSRGADVIAGGSGTDTFIFAPGDGGAAVSDGDTILDFTVGEDRIGLSSPLTFEAIAIQASGGNSLLRIANTGEILATLVGVSPGQLGASDFIGV
jgi:serralysin